MTNSKPRGTARRYVLDANALMSFFEDRRGAAEKVRQMLGGALRSNVPLLMSAINWAWKRHGESRALEVELKLQQLPIAVIGVDRERVSRTAALKQKYGLGYADAFAAELAIERSAWLVTADPEFAKVGKALPVYFLPRHQS